MNFKKGFTLIELLVVVAIIGVLASVVLASLNAARAKGADAAVKADMSSIRSQAELWYSDNGLKYNDVGGTALATCSGGMFSDPNVAVAITHMGTQDAAGSTIVCNTNANGQNWAVSVSLLKGAGTSWCVDNSGWAKAGVAFGGVCGPLFS